jgi:hypothetical protein
MAMMAPQISPHTPYFTFAAVTGVIDHTSRDSTMAGHVTGGNDVEIFRCSTLTHIIASADLMTDYDDVFDTIHLQGLTSALPTFANFRLRLAGQSRNTFGQSG